MYIAMNRFRVTAGCEAEFEEVWANRETYLEEVAGFKEFHLLRGTTADDITTYLSHSVWASHEAFEAWTKSEAFRKSHGGGRARQGVITGHPLFEGYEVVL